MQIYDVTGLIDNVMLHYSFVQGEEDKMDNFLELMYQASKNRRIKFSHDISIIDTNNKNLLR